MRSVVMLGDGSLFETWNGLSGPARNELTHISWWRLKRNKWQPRIRTELIAVGALTTGGQLTGPGMELQDFGVERLTDRSPNPSPKFGTPEYAAEFDKLVEAQFGKPKTRKVSGAQLVKFSSRREASKAIQRLGRTPKSFGSFTRKVPAGGIFEVTAAEFVELKNAGVKVSGVRRGDDLFEKSSAKPNPSTPPVTTASLVGKLSF